MALATTTLAGACDGNTNTISVTSATGFVAGSYCTVDAESMKIMAVSGTQISVFRGVRGTMAQAHTVYALVTVGTAAEFAAVTSGGAFGPYAMKPSIYTYAAAGAIAIKPGLHRIGAGQAGIIAYTLASPELRRGRHRTDVRDGLGLRPHHRLHGGLHAEHVVVQSGDVRRHGGVVVHGRRHWRQVVRQGVVQQPLGHAQRDLRLNVIGGGRLAWSPVPSSS